MPPPTPWEVITGSTLGPCSTQLENGRTSRSKSDVIFVPEGPGAEVQRLQLSCLQTKLKTALA